MNMNDSEAKQPKVTTFRLDPEIRAGAQAVADAERRSLNSAVNVLLGEALEARARKDTGR